jgi:hypothetical protein
MKFENGAEANRLVDTLNANLERYGFHNFKFTLKKFQSLFKPADSFYE